MACPVGLRKKHIPGHDEDHKEIFDFPFLKDEDTIAFLKAHGRLMFIVRGPSGTRKRELSMLLCDVYKGAILCCADNYMKNVTRTREGVAQSHQQCRDAAKEACVEGSNVIIVQNTHMRKCEMQDYINYAAENHYTVIMAITTRKYEVSPEILANTTTKNLKAKYFEGRLKHWQEVLPIATSWCLCPEDGLYLLHQVTIALEALSDDTDFRKVLDICNKEDLQALFKARKVLYCKAAHCCNDDDSRMKQYYLSDVVQDSYGKMFNIVVDGYIIDRNDIVAVVEVENSSKDLILDDSSNLDASPENALAAQFGKQLSLTQNALKHNKVEEFKKDNSDSGKTIELMNRQEADSINVKTCRFILLARKAYFQSDLELIESKCVSALSPFADEQGNLDTSKYVKLNDEIRILRLSDEAWYFRAPKKIKFQSVFTGLYI